MLGQQIIQDVVGLQPRRPLMSVPAPAVQQVQYRVFRLRARIVPWRGVNDVVVLLCRQSLDDLRGVVVQVQLPVGHGLYIPHLRPIARHLQLIPDKGIIGQHVQVIVGVELGLAIDLKCVTVNLRRQRRRGHRPQTRGIFCHRERLGARVDAKCNAGGPGSLIAEGDAAIRVDLCRR